MTFWLCWLAFGLGWGWCDLKRAQQQGLELTGRLPQFALSIVLATLAGPINAGITVQIQRGQLTGVWFFGKRMF